ncbi:MAG: hypothetical protein M9949_04630 [Candidatus Kapabacteria bacterium]|nr:hypothetical protein [Candidatus Kapabacteria bacterium]
MIRRRRQAHDDPVIPGTQIYGISFFNTTANSFDVQHLWSSSVYNGHGVIGVIRQGASVNVFPSDDTFYNASSVFGSGDDLGSGNYVFCLNARNAGVVPITVTNLASNTTYYCRYFAFNTAKGKVKYLTNTGTGNPRSKKTGS